MPRERDDDGFLTRWSRLKREGGDQAALTPEPAPEAGDAAPIGHNSEVAEPPEEELTDEELLERLELPNPEDLKAGDDFSGFMAKAVPQRIRRVALRKLWLTNPALANLDELVDYGEDYTDAATVVENMQTVYEVGKGAAHKYLKSLELERLKAAEEAAEAAPEPPDDAPRLADAQEDETLDAALESPGNAPEPEVAENIPDETFEHYAAPHITKVRAKPMRFTFS